MRVTSPGSKQCEGDVDSPGDGLPLDSVNPAYDLVNLRPAGFEPKVTGLEWMGDDLLVLTWGDDDGDPTSVTAAGEVWRLTGVKDADDPADVTPTKIAEGLREPMGIKVVDGDIYISEKHQLSKLLDSDANGVYESKDTIATWPFDGNFHEFAFGLLYKDGFFYLNLSVSIDLGGASTVPQGSDDRGTHLKINKDTGAIEYVAGGLRTPHGIGWGPEDEIFVTDNQGGWLPANKLIHVQPGKFYNHYTTGPTGTPGRFDDERPTPPALWLPHNEIANSPEPADADPERSVRRADVDRRRDLRRDPAGVPGEGRGRVPGRLLPDDPGPRVRHHAPGCSRTTARSSSAASAPAATGARPASCSSASRSSSRTAPRRSTSRRWSSPRAASTSPTPSRCRTRRSRSWPTSTTCSSGPTCRRRPTAAPRSTRRR